MNEKLKNKADAVIKKTKKALVKIGKRNLMVIMALFLIGGAVYLNFRLYDGNDTNGDFLVDGNISEQENGEVNAEEEYNYFTAEQISRQRARDEAIEVFRMIADSDTALDESKSAALDGINRIAENIEKEANIETLIESKGFSECVAVINEDSADIIVRAKGLMDNEIVQIQEIVYEQAGIIPSNVKIIENE